MERAQLVKKSRGADKQGYRCRRCGEPKRGHICAARMLLGETPEGEDLQIKAAALTEISKAALKNIKDGTMTEELEADLLAQMPITVGAGSDDPFADSPSLALAPLVPVPLTGRPGRAPVNTAADPNRLSSLPTLPAGHGLATPHLNVTRPTASAFADRAKSTSFVAAAAAVDSLDMSTNVDDFLEQLRMVLPNDDDGPAGGAAATTTGGGGATSHKANHPMMPSPAMLLPSHVASPTINALASPGLLAAARLNAANIAPPPPPMLQKVSLRMQQPPPAMQQKVTLTMQQPPPPAMQINTAAINAAAAVAGITALASPARGVPQLPMVAPPMFIPPPIVGAAAPPMPQQVWPTFAVAQQLNAVAAAANQQKQQQQHV